MEEPRNKYILLHDRVGIIIERNMLVLGLSTKSTPTQVLKGELLEALPESEQPNDSTRIALAGIDRKHLRLECDMQDIAKLTSEDANLLLGISSVGLRYEIYIDSNRLDFGRRISPGSHVKVKRLSKNVSIRGTVRYTGFVPPNLGTMFGVELIENHGLGNSDGTFRNKQYFSCPQNSGVFVGLDKLTPDYKLKIHQRVVTFAGDVPTRGTIHYIGEEKQSDGQIHTNVGLELLHEQLREKDMGMIRMEQQLRMKDGQQQNLQRQLREMEQQLTNCHGQLRQKDEQLRGKDEQLTGKDEQLTEKDEQLRVKDEQLRGKDEEQENLQEQLGEMEQQLREKEQQDENLQRQLREMGRQLTNFEEQLREREEERANLQQQNVFLERQLRDKEEEVNELKISLSTTQQTISEQRRQGTCDWVIARDEIQISAKCLGRGGWGSVYEGMYCGCTIAVKQIHELILSPHNRRLFEREINIASRCRHPCLLQFIGATNDEGSPLFLTELMEISLRGLLQQQELSETEVAVISLDVAKALGYLHEKKPEPIIHRDVSSANVLLWRQGDQWRGKVSDYGTANFMQHTMTVAPGAPIYSAPEAVSSNQTVQVDVYSYGVLLCEMNIRELPDPKRRDEQVALVTNRALRGLVRRCLQTDPEMRPSMLEIIDSLRQFNVKG